MLIAAGALMPVTIIVLDVVALFKGRLTCAVKANVSGVVSIIIFLGLSIVVVLKVPWTLPIFNVVMVVFL